MERACSPCRVVCVRFTEVWTTYNGSQPRLKGEYKMFKKLTTALTVSALSALALVSIASASVTCPR